MPLDSWTCDSCGQQITDPNLGNVINRRDQERRAFDFKIVHKSMGGRTCDPGWQGGYNDSLEISNFLGPEGQSSLLALLSTGPLIDAPQPGVADLDDYVTVFRRLQTPWFEEARKMFGTEHTQHWLGDAGESYPYTPEVLQRIAKQQLG